MILSHSLALSASTSCKLLAGRGSARSVIAMADGDVDRRGEHVVGALPHVDVVVGMDRLVLAAKRSPPSISMARLAITSLAFMLLDVPEPV